MYLYNQSDINSPESVSIKITDCEKKHLFSYYLKYIWLINTRFDILYPLSLDN